MSSDYWLYSKRTNSCVYLGTNWGPTTDGKQRKAAGEWIAEHVGEEIELHLDPQGDEFTEADKAMQFFDERVSAGHGD